MADQEEWRPVVGYEAVYSVSSFGRVRRIGQAAQNGKGRGGGARIGRIRKPQPHKGGYLSLQLWQDGELRLFLLHVLVARAFIGPCPDGKEVNHMDGVKTNCRSDNLEYLTRGENMEHAYDTGLCKIGEDHSQSKFSNADVAAMRAMHIPGKVGCRRIARVFGASKNTVQAILDGRSRKHG